LIAAWVILPDEGRYAIDDFRKSGQKAGLFFQKKAWIRP
jgi:hypothetical protein